MSGARRHTLDGGTMSVYKEYVLASDYDRDTRALIHQRNRRSFWIKQCMAVEAERDTLSTANHRLETELANLKEDRDQQYAMKVKAREQRNAVTAANQRLEQEVSKLKTVMANQSARQFVGHDDQRHIDDLVAAGIRASDAEMKRLEGEVANIKRLLAQAQGMVNGATDQWHDDVRAALRGKGGGE